MEAPFGNNLNPWAQPDHIKRMYAGKFEWFIH